jgi:hypothetical protein
MNTDKDPLVQQIEDQARELTRAMSFGEQLFGFDGYTTADRKDHRHVCNRLNSRPNDADVMTWHMDAGYTEQLMFVAAELGYVQHTNGLWSTTIVGRLATATGWALGQVTELTARELEAARQAALTTYMAKHGLIRRR